jgi:hypothetical protein
MRAIKSFGSQLMAKERTCSGGRNLRGAFD